MVYHIGFRRGKSYLYKGGVEYSLKDYWTSIKTTEEMNIWRVRGIAVGNIQKQIAKDMFGNVRRWKSIEIDGVDLEVTQA